MCAGNLWSTALCVLCRHSSLSGYAGKFYVLACFTFQLASFVRTEKLFNMPRTAMADDDAGGRAAVDVAVGACHTAMARILHKSLSVYNLLFLWHPAHTDTTIQTHVHLPHTSID